MSHVSRTLLCSIFLMGFSVRGLLDPFLTSRGRGIVAWGSCAVIAVVAVIAHLELRKAKKKFYESRARLEELLKGRTLQ